MEVTRIGRNEASKVLRARTLFDTHLSAAAVRSYLRDDRNIFLLATEAGVPAGFLRGTALGQLATRRRQMFLYEISVERVFRRRGVARALIRALLEYCRTRGFDEIFVFTDPHNLPAVALYRSTGGATETPADRMFVYKLSRGKPARARKVRARTGPSDPSVPRRIPARPRSRAAH